MAVGYGHDREKTKDTTVVSATWTLFSGHGVYLFIIY